METNYKVVARTMGTHLFSDTERAEADFYATSPAAAEWLIRIENLNHKIWECACGEGHLSKVFVDHGFEVRSTDLYDRGYGQGGVDFLEQTEPWDGDIVTNPPYKHSVAFIEKAMELLPEGGKLCLFLKLQFLEGTRRRKLFMRYPPKTVWVSSARIQHGRNGEFGNRSSMLATA